jgi:hypothetical protein
MNDALILFYAYRDYWVSFSYGWRRYASRRDGAEPADRRVKESCGSDTALNGRFTQSTGVTLAGRRKLDDALSNQFDCGIGAVNEPQFSKRGIERLRENLYVVRSECAPL